MEYEFFNKNQLKIIQLTDTHLFSVSSPLFGVNCNERLQDLANNFKDELADADFILLTGDLSQDESPESYQFLVDIIEPLGKPAFWIPGNHDDIGIMSNVFCKSKFMNRIDYLELKHWIFIFLNTKIKDSINGEISVSELNLIQHKLENSDKNIALIMHHHPAPVNTPLIDTYMLNHSNNLWELV